LQTEKPRITHLALSPTAGNQGPIAHSAHAQLGSLLKKGGHEAETKSMAGMAGMSTTSGSIGASGATGDIQAQLTKTACDTVLAQAKSFL
jgi:hypothetical protein